MPFTRIAQYANEGHLTTKFESLALEACEAWCTLKATNHGKDAASNLFNPYYDAQKAIQMAFDWGSMRQVNRMGIGNRIDPTDTPCNDGTLIANYLCTSRAIGSLILMDFKFANNTSRYVAWYASRGGLMGRDKHTYLFDPAGGEYRIKAASIKEFVAKYIQDVGSTPAGAPATFVICSVVSALESRKIRNNAIAKLKADRAILLRNKARGR